MTERLAEKIDVSFRAVQFRHDLDALMEKHNAKLILGWDGKWAKVQVQFPAAATDLRITIMETKKGGRMRYLTEVEDV